MLTKQKSILAILMLFILNSCYNSRQGVQLSTFLISGKQHNNLIIDRIPDYGDGHRDGCIVLGQISHDLVALSKNKISGKTLDTKTKEPLSYANVELSSEDGINLKKLKTDSLGYFETTFTNGLSTIEINSLGYRSLRIELSKLNKITE